MFKVDPDSLVCTNGASLTGQWTVDNSGAMFLNGQMVSSLPSSPVPFSSWHPVSLTTGFVCGTNCLDFYVTNLVNEFAVNPTGMRAELTNVFNDCCCDPAQPLLNVFSGRSPNGGPLLGSGAPDTQFAFTCPPPAPPPTTPVVIDSTALLPSWAPNTPISQWIGPDQFNSSAIGTYCYTLYFEIPCPTNVPIKASLTGRWIAYEWGEMYLNGQLVGTSLSYLNPPNTWDLISITSGFQSGLNTLTIYVQNEPGPVDGDLATGLRLELTGAYSCCDCTNNCDGFPPLSITCPTNQTHVVCAAPVVATYSPTVTGGGPPVFVSCSPASGTAFPYGTNVVTCTATDRCGARTNCSFKVIVQYAGNPPCVPPPIIIVRDGTNVVLSWPVSATNFELEAAESLSPPIEWLPENAVVQEADGRRFVTLPISGAQRFFRLRGPSEP